MKDNYGDPLNPEKFPATIKAADGKTDLRRYYVTGVVYAPDRAHAQSSIEQASIYFEAAAITGFQP